MRSTALLSRAAAPTNSIADPQEIFKQRAQAGISDVPPTTTRGSCVQGKSGKETTSSRETNVTLDPLPGNA